MTAPTDPEETTPLRDMMAVARDISAHLEAAGFPRATAADRQVFNLAEEVGEFVGAYRRWKGLARRPGPVEDVRAELADVVISAYVTAVELDVDLHAAVEAKLGEVYSRGWREGATPSDLQGTPNLGATMGQVASTVDCRSEEGVTAGLVDGIIAVARVAARRDLTPDPVRQALADLRADEDVRALLAAPAPVAGDLRERVSAAMRKADDEYWGIGAPGVEGFTAVALSVVGPELDRRDAEIADLRAFAATAHGQEAWSDLMARYDQARTELETETGRRRYVERERDDWKRTYEGVCRGLRKTKQERDALLAEKARLIAPYVNEDHRGGSWEDVWAHQEAKIASLTAEVKRLRDAWRVVLPVLCSNAIVARDRGWSDSKIRDTYRKVTEEAASWAASSSPVETQPDGACSSCGLMPDGSLPPVEPVSSEQADPGPRVRVEVERTVWSSVTPLASDVKLIDQAPAGQDGE